MNSLKCPIFVVLFRLLLFYLLYNRRMFIACLNLLFYLSLFVVVFFLAFCLLLHLYILYDKNISWKMECDLTKKKKEKKNLCNTIALQSIIFSVVFACVSLQSHTELTIKPFRCTSLISYVHIFVHCVNLFPFTFCQTKNFENKSFEMIFALIGKHSINRWWMQRH